MAFKGFSEVLIDVEDPGDEEEILKHRTKYIYRDAVCFAAQLHAVGFEELANSCPRLQRVRFSIWDNSFGYNSSQAKARGPLGLENSSEGALQHQLEALRCGPALPPGRGRERRRESRPGGTLAAGLAGMDRRGAGAGEGRHGGGGDGGGCPGDVAGSTSCKSLERGSECEPMAR